MIVRLTVDEFGARVEQRGGADLAGLARLDVQRRRVQRAELDVRAVLLRQRRLKTQPSEAGRQQASGGAHRELERRAILRRSAQRDHVAELCGDLRPERGGALVEDVEEDRGAALGAGGGAAGSAVVVRPVAAAAHV